MKKSSSKIKILHVTDSRTLAGTERALLMVIDYSDVSRFTHEVVCRGRGSFLDALNARTIPVRIISRFSKLDPIAFARFMLLLLLSRPDIVHIHGGRLEAFAAALCGIPVVERKNVCRNDYYRPLINTVWADRLLNKLVKMSIVPASAVRRHYIKRGYDPGKLRVIYNGVERAPERSPDENAETRRQLGVGNQAFLLAFAGRLAPEKGVPVLLAALGSLPVYVECVIMGDGLYLKEYKRLALETGIDGRVVFTGYRTDVRKVFAAADAVVVPSLSEPLANVVLEAFAEGKPVIGSCVDGMPEAIEDGVTGLLVPPGAIRALVSAIEKLAEDRLLVERMGAAARKRAQTSLSPSLMTSQTEQLYMEVLVQHASQYVDAYARSR